MTRCVMAAFVRTERIADCPRPATHIVHLPGGGQLTMCPSHAWRQRLISATAPPPT